jgi:hypothetical protein
MVHKDPLQARQASLDDAQQGLAMLSDLALSEHWHPDERAALADERDTVADASDEVAAAFDERAECRDDDAQSREARTSSRNEHAIAADPSLEPGRYLRHKAARDVQDAREERAGAADDRARSAAGREVAADARHRAAADRDEAATDRAISDEDILGADRS